MTASEIIVEINLFMNILDIKRILIKANLIKNTTNNNNNHHVKNTNDGR